MQLQRHASIGDVNEEAVELYLRARKRSRSPDLGDGPDSALALLERAIEIAPHFKPALAAHAIIAERMWFFPGTTRSVDWREIVRASVDRALAEAGDLAETHVAAARFSAHTMDLASAARSLSRALAIAPTSAAAHEFLGYLQCEAGRADEGIRHLELAAELDPTLTMGLLSAARHYELVGDHVRADEYLRRVREATNSETGLLAMEARFATWRGDTEAIVRCRERIRRSPGMFEFFLLITDVHLGERDAAEIEAAPPASTRGFSPRFATIGEQLTAEVLAAAGRLDGAIAALRRAVDHVLVDLVWIERCPLLEPLRTHPDYPELHARVRERAEAIWAID